MTVGKGLVNAVDTTHVLYNHCQKYACYMPVSTWDQLFLVVQCTQFYFTNHVHSLWMLKVCMLEICL